MEVNKENKNGPAQNRTADLIDVNDASSMGF